MWTSDYADATRTFTEPGDSKGDATCGKRTWTIVEAATYPWITLSSSAAKASKGNSITLTAAPRGVSAGAYTITLRGASDEYEST